jgi:hypothetical protein
MSGSSYNGRSFSGTTGMIEKTNVNCSNIGGNTIVISPTMIYFGTASIGDVLSVEVQGTTIALINSSGDTVGGIYPT